MTDADKERSSKDESKRLLKVAATYSPTTQCSTIGDAVSRCCPRPSAAPLSAPLSPAPARRRRAQPTPRMAHTADTARASEAGLAMSNSDYTARLHKIYGLSQ
ncbi:MAG: hypothetical protein IJ047_06370 [Paludibacteraceae bacterium]|nr:hypothetical protein [Paludibacteraceae bacterium]